MDWKQVASDFKAKYEGCYCFVTLEGYSMKQLFLLASVESTGAAPLLYLKNANVGTVILKYDDSKSDVEFTFPPIGLVGYQGKVYMVRRKHERQWKGGCCFGTLDIIDIYADLLPPKSIRPHPAWTGELMEAVYKKTPILSLTEGIAQLKSSVAVPLSSEFAIGLSPTTKEDFILFFYEKPIGVVSPSSQKVVLRESQFHQEFTDFVSSLRGLGNYAVHS